MAVFGEAIEAVTASCNFGVVVVALAVAIASRGDVRVIATVVGAALVGGWLFAADVSLPLGRFGGTIVHTVVLVALIIGVAFARRRVWLAAGLGGLAEFLATLWWRPCVGRELASIINRGSDEFVSAAGGMTLYMIGLLTPAIAVASLAYLVFERGRPTAPSPEASP